MMPTILIAWDLQNLGREDQVRLDDLGFVGFVNLVPLARVVVDVRGNLE